MGQAVRCCKLSCPGSLTLIVFRVCKCNSWNLWIRLWSGWKPHTQLHGEVQQGNSKRSQSEILQLGWGNWCTNSYILVRILSNLWIYFCSCIPRPTFPLSRLFGPTDGLVNVDSATWGPDLGPGIHLGTIGGLDQLGFPKFILHFC